MKKKYKSMPGALFVQADSSINIKNGDACFSEKGKQIVKAIDGDGPRDEKILGKKTNKDKIKGKYSFVDLYGEEKAKKIAVAHITQAKDVLSAYGKKSYYLDLLADYILDRKK